MANKRKTVEIMSREAGETDQFLSAETMRQPVDVSVGQVATGGALSPVVEKTEKQRVMGTWGVSGDVGPVVRALQVRGPVVEQEPLPPQAA